MKFETAPKNYQIYCKSYDEENDLFDEADWEQEDS